MKQLLLQEQIRFYREHGYIEFEEFLTEEEVYPLENEVKGALTKKMGSIKLAKPEDLYLNGKDLFFSNSKIKTFIKKRKFSSVIDSLSHVSQLRIAFDQALFFENDWITTPFSTENSYENISSYQGLVTGVIIQFEDQEPPEEDLTSEETAEDGYSIIPQKRGNVTFFDLTKLLDLKPLFSKETKVYIIGFSKAKTQYVFNPIDPLTHLLKNKGLSFGDPLKDNHWPPCLGSTKK